VLLGTDRRRCACRAQRHDDEQRKHAVSAPGRLIHHLHRIASGPQAFRWSAVRIIRYVEIGPIGLGSPARGDHETRPDDLNAGRDG
jgi:hypothetical protein